MVLTVTREEAREREFLEGILAVGRDIIECNYCDNENTRKSWEHLAFAINIFVDRMPCLSTTFIWKSLSF